MNKKSQYLALKMTFNSHAKIEKRNKITFSTITPTVFIIFQWKLLQLIIMWLFIRGKNFFSYVTLTGIKVHCPEIPLSEFTPLYPKKRAIFWFSFTFYVSNIRDNFNEMASKSFKVGLSFLWFAKKLLVKYLKLM